MQSLEALFALALRKWISEQKLNDPADKRIFARIRKKMEEMGKERKHAESDE